jgi:hypothetical protein
VATYYVRSTDGNDGDSGLTIALAKATLTGALAVAAAGDRVWVAANHSETTAGAVTLTPAGTAASPIEILCGDFATEPPTALATTAVITCTTAVALSIGSGFAYWYGLQFKASSQNSASSTLVIGSAANPTGHIFEQCVFQLQRVGASQVFFGPSASTGLDDQATRFQDCFFVFSNAGQTIRFRHGRFLFRGGTWAATGTVPTTLIDSPGTAAAAPVAQFDGMAFHTGITNIVDANVAAPMALFFRNCTVGGSTTLVTGTNPGPGGPDIRFDNCASDDTNFRMRRYQFGGTITESTTTYRNGGASDGTTRLSWRMVSAAAVRYTFPWYSPEIVVWVENIGPTNFCVEILTDGVSLTNGEIWYEILCLATSGSSLGVYTDTRKASVLATAAPIDDTDQTWTTTVGTPTKMRISQTVIIQEKGPAYLRIALARPSTEVFIDPAIRNQGTGGNHGGARQYLIAGFNYVNLESGGPIGLRQGGFMRARPRAAFR